SARGVDRRRVGMSFAPQTELAGELVPIVRAGRKPAGEVGAAPDAVGEGGARLSAPHAGRDSDHDLFPLGGGDERSKTAVCPDADAALEHRDEDQDAGPVAGPEYLLLEEGLRRPLVDPNGQ